MIPCGIVSNHDRPFACINIRAPRFQLGYKYTRNVKTFVEQAFIEDFAGSLPLLLIYAAGDPDEQLEYFNSMLVEYLDRHAPLKCVRLTRSPAPWIECEEIPLLQQQRDNLRRETHKSNSKKSWENFRLIETSSNKLFYRLVKTLQEACYP